MREKKGARIVLDNIMKKRDGVPIHGFRDGVVSFSNYIRFLNQIPK